MRRADASFFAFLVPFAGPYLIAASLGCLSLYEARLTLWASLMSGALVFALVSLLRRSRRIVLISIFLLVSFFSWVELAYLIRFEALPDVQTFYILFETNLSEAAEFITSYARSFLVTLPWAILEILLGIWLWRVDTSGVRRKLIWGVTLILFVPLLNKNNYPVLKESLTIRMLRSYWQYQDERAQLIHLYSRENLQAQDFQRRKPIPPSETIVVVVGESLTRRHMSLYGYERSTTPLLESIRDELFVFEDVISPHANTILSLKKIFSFADYEHPDDYKTRENLIQVMKRVGFHTYWISNQVPLGIHENLITLMAKTADRVQFVNFNHSYQETSLDEKLLSPYERALIEKYANKLIVLHMMGSHAEYEKRYPKRFERFPLSSAMSKKERAVNAYDNSVRYTDYLVHKMIEMLKARKDISALLFFADHGEDVFDETDAGFHAEAAVTKPMLEIPMILWLSPKYRQMYREKTARIASAVKRKFMTDELNYVILDLAQVELPNHMSKLNLFSSKYQRRKRLTAIGDYDGP